MALHRDSTRKTSFTSALLLALWVGAGGCANGAGGPAAPAAAVQAAPAASRAAASAPAEIDAPEREMLEAINAFRRAQGRAPLAWDPALARLSEAHSRDMARHGFVAHASPTHGGLTERLDAGGYVSHVARENVGLAETVARAMAGFAKSPGHRENLLSPDVTHVGVGIVPAPRGPGLHVTQIFARPAAGDAPEAVAEALRRQVDQARRARRRPPLPVEPVLQRLAERAAAEAARTGRMPDGRRLAAEASHALRGAGRPDLPRVSASVQRVLDASALAVPDSALQPDAGALGVAAALFRDEGGRPRVLVVAVVALGG